MEILEGRVVGFSISRRTRTNRIRHANGSFHFVQVLLGTSGGVGRRELFVSGKWDAKWGKIEGVRQTRWVGCLSPIAGSVVTLQCQSYKPIGFCCKGGGVPSEPFIQLFVTNLLQVQWLRQIVHRRTLSGTTIAYDMTTPIVHREGRLTDGFPSTIMSKPSPLHAHARTKSPGLLPQPPAYPRRWLFFALRFSLAWRQEGAPRLSRPATRRRVACASRTRRPPENRAMRSTGDWPCFRETHEAPISSIPFARKP